MGSQVSAALVLFVATIAISLIGLFGAPKLIERSLFRPYWFLRRKEYDTVIMSGFVHADLMHLIFNMMTFYFFAFPLERYMGTTSFVILYLAGLLISHAGTYYKQRRNPDYACLGASGAISAVLFAAIVYFPEQSLIILPIPIPIPAPLFAVLYLVYTYYASRHPHGRINHDAHLGGAITGLLFVAVTEPGAYGNLLQSIL
ncbi:MAG TPA: rhomboid family intramembrane serine protease [Steroidobacteraceae bacterium]|nr:rhomboid family intramembrane serine protease [Steroidobacteraceae bacterium]